MDARKRSLVWKHFTTVEPGKAKCGFCDNVLSYTGGSTGNLVRHIRMKHQRLGLHLRGTTTISKCQKSKAVEESITEEVNLILKPMTSQMDQIHSATGLIVAPFTPFKKNGDVNFALIPAYINHLAKNNVRGAFVNGTTGEGVSLTVEERKKIAELWVTEGKDKLDVIIIQIGTSNIKDSQELAKHAEKIGATAIASLPPLYYKPATEDQLIQYLKAIASAAPSLPFMYYHIPSFTGVEVSLSKLLHDGEQQIPTFCGAKYTSSDSKELFKSLQLKKFKILTGYDEILLAGLPHGITAAVGATYNFMPAPSNEILQAYHSENMTVAWDKQMYVREVLDVIGKHGNIMSALKAVMNLFGPFDVGEPRLPLTKLTDVQISDIKTELSKMNPTSWYN